MMTVVDAESMLVVDVGSVTTRAILFDVVEGKYRFIAMGIARTTAAAPFHNIGEGVRLALDELHQITGRVFVDSQQQLILPGSGNGSGVDRFAAMISAGEPLKVVVVGLLEDVSGESARRLAETTYSEILQTFGLNDRRKPEARLNLMTRLKPDLIVAAGGTDGGASKSLLALMETVGLACYLTPESERPPIFFAGNAEMADGVKASMEGITPVYTAPNIRPALDQEQLGAAQFELAKFTCQIRSQKMPGVEELRSWAGEGLVPGATAFGRVVRFLRQGRPELDSYNPDTAH